MTADHAAGESLIRSQLHHATLAAIVESSDDAIISKTLDGIITTWNAAAERMFEFTAQEAIGQPIAICFPPDRAEEEAVILQKLRNGERVHHLETIRRTKSGKFIHVSLTSSPIKDPTGRVVGASKIVRDISDRKKSEEFIRRQQLEMQHLARLNTVGEMAAGLAHELNQPLSSILTYAGITLESVLKGNGSPQRTGGALTEIVAETRRAAEIIARIRRFIRKRDPLCEALDVNLLVMDAAHILEAHSKRVEFNTILRLAQNLPPAWADPVQVTQVLVNLINNAKDAMLDPAASGRDLTIASSASGDKIRVDVIDRGGGCGPENMDRLFEPFFSTKSDGLGMGLAISKSIMVSLRGELTCSSNSPNAGMTFSMTLPAAKG